MDCLKNNNNNKTCNLQENADKTDWDPNLFFSILWLKLNPWRSAPKIKFPIKKSLKTPYDVFGYI